MHGPWVLSLHAERGSGEAVLLWKGTGGRMGSKTRVGRGQVKVE